MRVLYFSNGLSVHDVRFLSALATRHDVFFLRLSRSGGGSGLSIPSGVQELFLSAEAPSSSPADALLDRVPELLRILGETRPDVVQAGPLPTCAFLIASTGFTPFVAVSWGSDLLVESESTPHMRWRTAYVLDRAAALLCDANVVREKAQRDFGVPDERILQLPWGTDLDQFFPGSDEMGLRESFGWHDANVFLWTRSWEHLYGIGTMLEAFRELRETHSSARLILLGGGSQAPMVERFLDEHQLRAHVALPGFISREELPHYFRASDFYVSCSHSDGTSISLLEAQASGLPVIVSDLPANREWVEDGVHGWLSAAGDARAFADAFRRVCDLTPSERQRIARISRAQVVARADWRKHAERMLDGIERAVARQTKI